MAQSGVPVSVSQTFGDCNLEINDSREKNWRSKKGGDIGGIYIGVGIGVGVGVGALSGFCLGYFGLDLGFFGFFIFLQKPLKTVCLCRFVDVFEKIEKQPFRAIFCTFAL